MWINIRDNAGQKNGSSSVEPDLGEFLETIFFLSPKESLFILQHAEPSPAYHREIK